MSTTKLPSPSVDAGVEAGVSIRVVANRTGIPADTLRMWERRYGFPRPARRPGGSRVYAEADVQRLRLVAQALAAGFRPSEAVPLSMDDLARLVAASADDARQPPAAPPPPAFTGGSAEGTQDAVIAALLADDLGRVRSSLRAAALTLGPRAFVAELAHPLMIRIGEGWANGSLEIRHEHVVTACLSSQLHILLSALDDGARSPTVLLAALPGEQHLLGLEMIAVYLAASLAAPRMLGTDAPTDQIAAAARAVRADAVGLTISPAADGRAVARALRELASALPQTTTLWLGGAGARAVAASAPSARVVADWSELDAALDDVRAARFAPRL